MDQISQDPLIEMINNTLQFFMIADSMPHFDRT